jgi:glucose/arabinose dehydrogenase
MRGLGAVVALFLIFRIEAAYRVELMTGGFSAPIAVTAPPGDTTRLFVAEQFSGRIRIYNRSTKTILPTEFIDVTGLLASESEQGLLGLAFHPDYANNGYFYVNYTAPGGGAAGHTEIARFQVSGSPATSNVADPNSRTVILTFNQPESNHNGGWIGFGQDEYLYIATGDGGGGNDQHGTIGNAQDRTSLLGKILRIDVNNGSPYSIPSSNPYAAHATYRKEIWAWGLRNPWRCSIDRLTGDLWIGDVGQSSREEIDFNPEGQGDLNFGWRPREGDIATPFFNPSESPQTTATEPVFAYGRGLGSTVTGGYVYRGSKIPELQGIYVFADFGSGRFWTITHSGSTFTAEEKTSTFNPSSGGLAGNPASFGEDGVGELFLLDYSDGQLLAIVPNHPLAVNDSLVRPRNGSGKIHISTLLANDSDALGHTINLQSFASSSANGATISQDGNWILYNPAENFNASDTFTYTINDGEGFTATAAVNVSVATDSGGETLNIVSAIRSGNDIVIRCAGIPGRTYQIQYTADLEAQPIQWTVHPSGTLVAGADGTFGLTDSPGPNDRFYRAIQVNP